MLNLKKKCFCVYCCARLATCRIALQSFDVFLIFVNNSKIISYQFVCSVLFIMKYIVSKEMLLFLFLILTIRDKRQILVENSNFQKRKKCLFWEG